MINKTSEQEINHIELFLEAMSQFSNIFAGIKQQDSLPMTNEERDELKKEWLNFCDYNYILEGAYVEGFSIGMGFLESNKPIPHDIWNKGEAVYKSLEQPATHPMTQEERNQFTDKWLERTVFGNTQIGAFKHGHIEGEKAKNNLEIAHKLKELGVSAEIIMKVTRLSDEEIEQL